MVGQPGPGIDHRVDRAASAEHLAAWPVQAPILQLALLASLVGPIEAGLEQLGKGGWDIDLQLAVLWPGLQQQRRGLRAPWLVVTDGAPGLLKAITELWPEADRQLSTVHRLRNIVAKLPDRPELHERIKAASWAALDEATDPEDAEQRLRQVVTSLEQEYPSAATCLAEDLPGLGVHLKYFPRLRKRFPSSNLLERSLEEVRRRTKVIGLLPW